MKTAAAVLLAGLLVVPAVRGQENAPSPPGPSQFQTRKPRAVDDFVTLNFTNIDISALVKVMSELMRRNFILDERVSGKVTLMTPSKISPEEAYQVFLSALEMKGFTAVDEGAITKIVPSATARQSGLKVFTDNDLQGQGFVTKLIRLTYVNPNDLVRTLTPLVSKDGSIISYPVTNSLIITDSVPNIRKIESLVTAFDVPASEGKGKINVYYLKHANAEDFAKVMSALVSRLPTPQAGGAQPGGGPATILEGQVTITADKSTNALIVVASPGDYETVRDVIQKLDIRRRQVYVEAAIIEMSLNKQRELGLEFQGTNLDNLSDTSKTSAIGGTNFGNIGAAIAGGPTALGTMSGLTVGAIKGTFEYGGNTFLNIGALLRALQTDSDVNVLSTPNILTTDNQKAEIMVGENVPFVTGQSQSATTGGALQTLIDRRDVGIKLSITPQITSDDNVKLDVYQEISAVVETAGLNANQVGPTTSKRSASTTVVVKDRDTMVIGGLIRDNVTSTISKVPLLGDIPLLGWLFKFKSTRVEKTNLMIFITPYIIKDADDAGTITRKKGEGLEEFREKYGIEKKLDPSTMITPDTRVMGGTAGTKQINSMPQPVPSTEGSIESGITGTIPPPINGMPMQSAPTGTVLNGTATHSAPTGTVPAVPDGGPR